MKPGRDARVALALGVVVLVMGFWPWRPLVHLFPHGSDATKWVQLSHPTTDGWFDYVFFTRHFIGYRPVAALTYTIDGLVSGWDPWAYRLTDIALHVLVPVLLFGVYRALTGDRSAWGLLAPIVFLLHPATEDVVPHLARRSYSLSCALSLAGLLAFVGAARTPERPWSSRTWLATGCLLLALASNEVAGVVVAMLPLLALHLRPQGTSWAWSLLPVVPVAVGTGALLLVRTAILGYSGGYHKRYFAYTEHGQNLLREVDDTPYLQIVDAAWRYALFPSSASGEPALLSGLLGGIVAITVVGFYAWHGAVRPAAAWRDPERRVPGLLIVWIVGYTVLYALTRNWFWRQAYPMLLPLALLFTVLARDTARAHGPAGLRLARALPQVALLASLAWHSPALQGVDTSILNGPIKMSASIDDVRVAVTDHGVEEPAIVYLALPTRAGNAHMVRIWSDLLFERRRVTFKLLAVSEPTAAVTMDDPLLELVDDRLLRLAPGMEWADVAMTRFGIAQGATVPLGLLRTQGARTYVYWRDGDAARLVEVPGRAEAAPRAPLRQRSR